MEQMLIQVLNMSFTAGYVILLVLVLRVLLRKAPKWLVCLLWFVVLFRLLCPFGLEGAFSLLAMNPEPIPMDIGFAQKPAIETGISLVDGSIGTLLPEATPAVSINPMQMWLWLGGIVWLAGVVLMATWGLWSLWRLKRWLRGAQWEQDNIYVVSTLAVPFVWGFLRPRIYLPQGLSAEQRQYVLRHEQAHIKRGDHLVKVLAFAALCLHWFNPLVWLSFRLLERDMEMACDEKVLSHLGEEAKKAYSHCLLTLSTKQMGWLSVPLAFGESEVKARITRILQYKKPILVLVVVASVVVVVVAAGLLANPPMPQGEAPYVLSNESMNEEKTKDWVTSPEGIVKAQMANTLFTGLFEQLMTASEAETPQAYIAANEAVYQEICSYGEATLLYCFVQFEHGGETGLKGELMMLVCEDLLSGEELPQDMADAQAWYDTFKQLALDEVGNREMLEKHQPGKYLLLSMLRGEVGNTEIFLPDYRYDGEDALLQLLYTTELEAYGPEIGFVVPAVEVVAHSQEETQLKIFAVVHCSAFRLYGDALYEVGGSLMPVAITYVMDDEGNYQLLQYQQPNDGSNYAPSIEAFCTTPITQQEIKGLAQQLLMADTKALVELQQNNLKAHLTKYGCYDIQLVDAYGERTPL